MSTSYFRNTKISHNFFISIRTDLTLRKFPKDSENFFDRKILMLEIKNCENSFNFGFINSKQKNNC